MISNLYKKNSNVRFTSVKSIYQGFTTVMKEYRNFFFGYDLAHRLAFTTGLLFGDPSSVEKGLFSGMGPVGVNPNPPDPLAVDPTPTNGVFNPAG